jgi:hypothetical protein
MDTSCDVRARIRVAAVAQVNSRPCIDGFAAARYLPIMRAEMQALADEIQQSLALLRRHL